MVDFEFVNNSNISYIECHSRKSKSFNPLNKDFFSSYSSKKFLGRLAIKNKCLLIRDSDKIVGYIWASSFKDEKCLINELYIEDDVPIQSIGTINNLFTPFSSIHYSSIRKFNTNIYLEALGFIKKRSVLKMTMDRTCYKFSMDKNPTDVSVKFYKEGRDEDLRCTIQNDIFRCVSRKELNVSDIFADENQSYYIEKGALFLTVGDDVIGYAQIIHHEGYLTIVNFGIIPTYRQRGYGTLLLKEILNLSVILFPYETIVKIDVFEDNKSAIGLYKKFGFHEDCIVDNWELCTKI